MEQLLLTPQQELTGTVIGNRFCDYSSLELGRVQLVIVSDPKRDYKRGHMWDFMKLLSGSVHHGARSEPGSVRCIFGRNLSL